MKNRMRFHSRILFFSAVFIIFILFFLFRSQKMYSLFGIDSQTSSMKSSTAPNLNRQSNSSYQDEPTEPTHVEGHQKSTQISSGKTDESDLEDTQKADCYARIGSQMEQSDFSTRKKEKLQHLVDSWILKGDSHWPDVENEAHFINTFYRALASADLLKGDFEFNHIDPIPLLIKLSKMEPGNSAPLVFLALIYEKQDNSAQVEKYVEAIKKTRYFDSHFVEFTRALEDMSENLEDTFTALGLINRLPIPNYTSVQKFAVKYELQKLGYQLIEANYAKTAQMDLVNTNAIEYVVGVQILKNLGIQHRYPSRQEFLEKLKSTFAEIKPYWDDVFKNCDLTAITPIYNYRKKFLKEHPLISSRKRERP